MLPALEMLINNFPLTMLAVSMIVALAKRNGFFNRLLFSTLFFTIGLGGIWGFIIHTMSLPLNLGRIAWELDPLKYAVAIAHLAIGVNGIIAAFSSYGYKKATIAMASIFLWGEVIGHLYQNYTMLNIQPREIWITMFTNTITPILAWVAIIFSKNKEIASDYIL